MTTAAGARDIALTALGSTLRAHRSNFYVMLGGCIRKLFGKRDLALGVASGLSSEIGCMMTTLGHKVENFIHSRSNG